MLISWVDFLHSLTAVSMHASPFERFPLVCLKSFESQTLVAQDYSKWWNIIFFCKIVDGKREGGLELLINIPKEISHYTWIVWRFVNKMFWLLCWPSNDWFSCISRFSASLTRFFSVSRDLIITSVLTILSFISL